MLTHLYSEFVSQGAALDMAYMDVKPARPNGRTVVLLHGKNFCAATWAESIRVVFSRVVFSRNESDPAASMQTDTIRS
jgi:pimeloyl-ACP methyl ester carboxylesterase